MSKAQSHRTALLDRLSFTYLSSGRDFSFDSIFRPEEAKKFKNLLVLRRQIEIHAAAVLRVALIGAGQKPQSVPPSIASNETLWRFFSTKQERAVSDAFLVSRMSVDSAAQRLCAQAKGPMANVLMSLCMEAVDWTAAGVEFTDMCRPNLTTAQLELLYRWRMKADALKHKALILIPGVHDVALLAATADLMPAEFFETEFGLKPDTMRKRHKRHGDIGGVMVGRRMHYSVSRAQRVWPNVINYGPTDRNGQNRTKGESP